MTLKYVIPNSLKVGKNKNCEKKVRRFTENLTNESLKLINAMMLALMMYLYDFTLIFHVINDFGTSVKEGALIMFVDGIVLGDVLNIFGKLYRLIQIYFKV